jgi:hypothetical protein
MDEYVVGVADWHNTTTIHPLGVFVTLSLGVLLVLTPRHYAIAPMVLLACFIPSAQRLVVMGADFDLLRILVLFAWVRLLVRNEFQGFIWNRLDTMVVAWMFSGIFIYTLAYGTQSAFVNRCGWAFDGFGMYFFFRSMLRDWKDIEFLICALILISFPLAIAFCWERLTGRNMFSIFGGVPETTVVRDGKLRCQGAYSHAILAGCFWVVTMPWMIAQVVNGRKWMGLAGIGAAMVVVVNCSSSTPILALGFMVLGVSLYFARDYLRVIRWGFLLLLVVLHLVMNNPVWHLLARVNVVGGSTGWHRFRIMDATINNFSEWWLLGEKDPMSWGVWEMRDITNQYILEALRGGLLTLTCYIIMIGVAFGLVGKSLRSCGDETSKRVLVWSIGTSLFVHVCIYFSVSYFGQIIMLWYLTLAMIGSLPTMDRGTVNLDSGSKTYSEASSTPWGRIPSTRLG